MRSLNSSLNNSFPILLLCNSRRVLKKLFYYSVIPSFFLCSSINAFGQGEKAKERDIIAVTAGIGVLTFQGDVGSNSVVGSYSYIRPGFSVSLEKNINKNFSISLNFLQGKIARDEKASDNLPKLNFESPITQIGLSATYLMAGKNDPTVIPFIAAGISYLMFDPHGDQLDRNGNPYYYWKDGSIRDLPDTGINYFYAQNVTRDYKYETKLTDSTNNYSRSTIALPLTAGIKIKLGSRWDANLSLTYHYTFTDYLDNVKAGGNDGYLFTSTSLTWHIVGMTKEEKEKISSVDYTTIDNGDGDKDGVMDVNDQCPGTPKEAKVDAKGCPIDSDSDGVPDYMDKEPKSKSGVRVDANGVELTKARMAEMQKQNNDPNSAALHKYANSSEFNQKPSAEFMKQIEEMEKERRKNPENKTPSIVIPYDLRVADWNKDGFITSDEIAKTIDSFFDGSITFSAAQINRLIDFFFEQ